ncbi:flagellar motor switch protein FliM [Oceanisphaera arctica]|uniref:Flagellar motor switch protein FliM n=1 Tax=Oceanisphaera arctica TaxID=641510 RepID=A0A2P5TMN3_9GAMM|nr:flagellar motor switch protein FliM [Oceanisphaera arctica]PPL16752.1 flagellar motor switch protein FliM [Oceanisphaera arctica]GHA06089.1 flagellar motor switch protein FliM [Oceanisphaera arctica]
MSKDELLSQQEIDTLLNGVFDEEEHAVIQQSPRARLFDPATQHRIIRERLHALDVINERFARQFRMGLFNLIRRSADITVESVRHQSYSDFARNVPVPTNINLITMKPLRGTALVVFPPGLIFMVVDNLFGGDGRFISQSDGRDFTNTEQRIIRRILNLAIDAYQDAWKAVYPLEIGYLRSEMQTKFANITNTQADIVVNTSFHMEVGNLSNDFQICIPYSMLEPLRDQLSKLKAENSTASNGDGMWTRRMAGEIKQSEVELVANFVTLPSRLAQVMTLKVGDVLPMELPDSVLAGVDGVPVLECEFGSENEQRALRVTRIIDHTAHAADNADNFVRNLLPKDPLKETNHD